MTRKRLVLAAAIVAIVGLAAAGTNAFITSEAHTTNVITTGAVSIVLNDKIEDGKAVTSTVDGETVTIGWKLDGVMPGVDVDKTVSVTNVGPGDAWVRVKVTKTITPADGVAETLSADKVTITPDKDWVDGRDGYYYYSKPMKAKDVTSDLFRAVTFAPDMSNAYQGSTVTIQVSAQAVQVKNNGADLTALTADNYTQVKGWPSDAAAEPGNTTGGDTTGGDTTGGDTTGGGTSSGTPVEP